GVLEIPPAPGMARWRWSRAGITAACLVLALAQSGPATAAVDPVGPIAAIQFEGNVSITVDQMRAQIKSRPGRPLDRKTIEDDRKKLVGTKWFSDVETYYRDDPKGKGFLLIF